MNCPVCKSKDARRSRRQGTADLLFSALALYPWRCKKCEARFYARRMSLSDSLHAHCPICGNHEVKRVSPGLVNSPLGFLWRRLPIPAYRCDPCRHKYFSIRPQRNSEREMAPMTPAD
jgi:putative FmdB family regulatory protein